MRQQLPSLKENYGLQINKEKSRTQTSSGDRKIIGPLTNDYSTAKVRFATSDYNKFELENLINKTLSWYKIISTVAILKVYSEQLWQILKTLSFETYHWMKIANFSQYVG